MKINTIKNIDCMIGMKNMEDNSVDITLTDIPYGEVSRNSNGLRDLDKEDADVFDLDMNELLSEILRVTAGQVIVFCGREQFSEIYSFFAKEKGTTRPLIWEKSNPSPMNGQYVYLSGVELAVWFKPRGWKTFNPHCKNTVFRHSNGTRKIHPTQKNIDLWKELIIDNTDEGQVVFDPFMGSATTALASMELKRNFYGFELSKEYYDLSLGRITEFLKENDVNKVSEYKKKNEY